MRVIKERLEKELETNVALKMEDTVDSDTVQVLGPLPRRPERHRRSLSARRGPQSSPQAAPESTITTDSTRCRGAGCST